MTFAQAARPTATISGRVLDAGSNEPIVGATVVIAALDAPPGTSAQPSSMTNDRGEFSFTNLSPGRYDLSARKSRYLSLGYGQRPGSGLPGVSVRVTTGQHVQDVVIRLPLTSVIAGTVTDIRGEPAQGSTANVYRLEWRNGERGARFVASDVVDDRGQYRIPGLAPGDYLVAATTSAPVPSRPTMTFYPGTPVPALALPVTLGVSEERNGVNIQLSAMVLSTVSGTVSTADGKVVPDIKIAATETVSAMRGFNFKTTYSTATGGFRFDNLPPGQYQLLASEERPASAGTARWAVADLIADGNPVKDVSLLLREGETVSGRIVVDGTNPPPASPRLTLSTLDRDPTYSASFSARLDPEGRFSFVGVIPGRYLLVASNLPAGYLISAVRLDGRDVCDLPINVRPSQALQGMEMKLSPNGASLSGTLLDSSGRPSSDLLVIVFPADEQYWLPGSRRIRTARPANDGQFLLRSLPPGSYRVGVVTDAEPGEWFAPSFLKKLVPTSVAVSLSDGESRTLDVKVK